MARCPECEAEMDTMATACAECGWDFPSAPEAKRTGWAYSPLATLALVVGQMAAILAAGMAIIGSVTSVLHGDLLVGLVVHPLKALLLFAISVVFARALSVEA